ncbi:hypothetical protein [Massilia soli]|uniref:Uncharacterized protein n=1 Tax=Massilia soli TaxID=2792854 RepID=A0ABS7SW22_9BURK|nr:hypothetical protein [Massilia soli]MBZ2210125.1 hypothetical protein [Massilia soli]
MSTTEKIGAKMAGWPAHIFMPGDLKNMLENNSKRRPSRVEKFGGGK